MKFKRLLLIAITSWFVAGLLSTSQVQAQQEECTQTGLLQNTANGALALLDSTMPDNCFKAATREGTPSNSESTMGGKWSGDPGDRSGVIPDMTKRVAFLMETKPVSTTEYIADVINNIVPGTRPAYAQTGIGFNALQPILPLWKAFRNVAYFLYVIIFVIIGFMIMLRSKINPQTVVTLQAALPNLIVTLILITFSYAIAGLLVDLIYVGIYLIVFIFVGARVFTDGGYIVNRMLSENLWSIMFHGQNFLVTAPANAIGAVVEGVTGGDGSILADTLGWGAEALSKLIIAAALTISVFKLFVTLGLGFVKILIAVIFAPLQIMLNAFPGSTAFSTWFRGILSNVAMFPAVAALFLIGAALMGPVDDAENPNPWRVGDGVGYNRNDQSAYENQWTPPFIVGRGTVLFSSEGEGAISPLTSIIGLMIILMSPSVAQIARDTLKVEASKYGSTIMQPVAQGTSLARAPISFFRQQRQQKKHDDHLGQSIARHIQGAGHTGP